MSKLKTQIQNSKLKSIRENLRFKLRERIIKLAAKTPTHYPHIGSCLSCIDILIQTLIYEMQPQDKFILSKGHAALALYVVLNFLGKITKKELEESYFQEGTQLGLHTPSTLRDDIPLATGSLGHGLSFAAGLAKAYKLLRLDTRRVYCLMSDGECNEGAVWEAAQFASAKNLDNLIAIIDRNQLQAFGRTKEVLGDSASPAKWRSFGFNVLTCNGHSLKELEEKFRDMEKLRNNKPKMLICNTIRGKGIRAIEGKLESNYTAMVGKVYEEALQDIKKL